MWEIDEHDGNLYIGMIAGLGVNFLIDNSSRLMADVNLIRSIGDKNDSKIALRYAKQINCEFKEIRRNLQNINSRKVGWNKKEQRIIHVHKIIAESLKTFRNDLLYKKYPFLTIPTLFTLSDLTLFVHHIVNKFELPIKSSLYYFTRKLRDILLYFRHSSTQYRLREVGYI